MIRHNGYVYCLPSTVSVACSSHNVLLHDNYHPKRAFSYNGPYAKFLNRAHLFFKRGAGDLIFTTCDYYGLNNVVFNF